MKTLATFYVKLSILWALSLIAFASSAHASQCQNELSKLLIQAKALIIANFDRDEPCYKAALLGRTQGRQGCYPPKAFILKDLMSPIAQKAQEICNTTCAKESLTTECKEITSQRIREYKHPFSTKKLGGLTDYQFICWI